MVSEHRLDLGNETLLPLPPSKGEKMDWGSWNQRENRSSRSRDPFFRQITRIGIRRNHLLRFGNPMACQELKDLLQQYLVAVAEYGEVNTEGSDPGLTDKLRLAVQSALSTLDKHNQTHECKYSDG